MTPTPVKVHRKNVTRKDHLDKTSKHYRPLHEPKFMQNWLVELTAIEPQIMTMLKPYNVNRMKPIAYQVRTPADRAIFNYLRVVISSEVQNYRIKGMARGSSWLVFDEISGSFLGLFSISDAALPWGPFSDWAGGKVGLDCMRQGTNTMHTVIAMKRCLPSFEFGPLTGGKLIALMGTSREVLETHELQYSLPLTAMIVKTQKGKSSQYNRLHPRGIIYQGEAPDGAGVYITQLREHAKPYLLERAEDPGKPLTFSLTDQFDYWRERWLPNKLAMTDNGTVTPDLERYRLSNMIREKMDQRMNADRALIEGDD